MDLPLPDSGDGRVPPRPSELPTPALWSEREPGLAPAAFRDTAEQHADVPPRTRSRMAAIYAGVVGVVLGVVLLGVAFVTTTLWLGVTGGVLAVVGGAVMLKAGVLTVVSIGQSPVGPG